MADVLLVRGLRKSFESEALPLWALRGVDLELRSGEFVAVMGPSGCGKSTLLNLVAGVEAPTDGEIVLAGQSLVHKDEDERARTRRIHIGFVFQFFNLLEGMSVLENVVLAAVIAGGSRSQGETRARGLLDLLGLGAKADDLPGVLSGGQRQRLAIARALVNEPTLLLADEPTGALDSAGATEVLELFRRLHSGGQTILLVTHDERVAEAAERVVSMRDGRVHADVPEPTPFSGKDVACRPSACACGAELRSRWRAWLTLAVLAGLGAGLVIATAAGARRTDDAVARYRAAAEVFDVWVGKNEMSEAAFARVEKLPQVARAIRSVDLAFWGRNDAGRAVTVNDAELNAPINGPEAGHERTKYLSGRPPDPARPDEIYVGARAAEDNDLQVGSTLRVRVATPRELERFAATSRFRAGADPETTGTGPLLTLRVVGSCSRGPVRGRPWDLCRCHVASMRPTGRGWAYGVSSRRSGSSAGTRSWTRSGPGSSGWPEESSSRSTRTGATPRNSKARSISKPRLCVVLAAAGRARRAGPRRAGARPPGRSRVERASAPAVARDDAPPALRPGHDAGRPRRVSRPGRSPSVLP